MATSLDRWPRDQVGVELVLTQALLLDGVLAAAGLLAVGDPARPRLRAATALLLCG